MAEAALRSFTAGDGYVWQFRRYEPTGTPRASVVLLHGIQSHGGWYGDTCQGLADNGYSVSFLDRRGCGLNDRGRGDAPSFRRLLDDIAEFLRDQPRPRFLVGISWGGKLAVALQRRHPGLTDGLVLIALAYAHGAGRRSANGCESLRHSSPRGEHFRSRSTIPSCSLLILSGSNSFATIRWPCAKRQGDCCSRAVAWTCICGSPPGT